jgi:hypothetical protein
VTRARRACLISMSQRPIRTLLLFAAAFAALLAFAPGAMAHSWRGDRNHDRLPDRWERANHLSLKVNQAKRDQDHDGLRNRAEFMAGDNPRDDDSDNDGIEDGQEKAGTITSFTNGVLIVHLFNGDDVKGTVDDNTEIECEHGDEARAADDGPGDDDGGDDHGDRSGPGHGDDEGDDDENDDENEANCDASALVPGAVVKEAELKATAAGLIFREIELIG